MSKPYLFDGPILPKGFAFPLGYLELARSQAPPDYAPWHFLFADLPASLSYLGAMLQKFPDKPLVPFAIIDDQSGTYNGGWVVLALFDGDDGSGNPGVYLFDYSKPPKGRSQLESFKDFDAWLAYAKDESRRYNDD